MKRLRELSLTGQLLLTVLVPVVALSATTSALFIAYGSHPIDLATRERGLAIARFLAPATEYAVMSGNTEGLDGMLGAALGQDGVVAVAVFDAGAAPLARRGDMQIFDPQWLTGTERARVDASRPGRLAFAAPVRPTPIDVGGPVAPAAASPIGAALPTGWVYLELDTRPMEAARRNVVLTAILLAIGVLALAAIPAIRLAHRLGDPVARLADAVGRVAAGQLDVPMPACNAARDMEVLEKGFSTMSAKIADAQRRMKETSGDATSKLEYLALHDPLTGMLNRRAFEKGLEIALHASRRSADHGATLCFVDLDHFKEVNDACGHAAGDALLRSVAALFSRHMRAGDRVYRIGGDEFAIILDGCSPQDARRIAEGLCKAIAALQFTWGGHTFRIGASIGLARIENRSTSAAALLEGADAACYVAKRGGRSRVVEHQPAPVIGSQHAA